MPLSFVSFRTNQHCFCPIAPLSSCDESPCVIRSCTERDTHTEEEERERERDTHTRKKKRESERERDTHTHTWLCCKSEEAANILSARRPHLARRRIWIGDLPSASLAPGRWEPI
jgi:hypothetical protein